MPAREFLQNNPLFLHVLDPVEPSPLRYDFLIYSSLDALDAKLREQDEALASHALQSALLSLLLLRWC